MRCLHISSACWNPYDANQRLPIRPLGNLQRATSKHKKHSDKSNKPWMPELANVGSEILPTQQNCAYLYSTSTPEDTNLGVSLSWRTIAIS